MKLYKVLLFLSLSLTGCATSGKSLRVFFAGEGKIQHFVSPTRFDSDNGRVSIDFTHRYRDTLPVTVNFTVDGREHNISKISFLDDSDTIYTSALSMIYREAGNARSRYTLTLSEESFRSFIESSNPTIVLDGSTLYKPHRSTRKAFLEASGNIQYGNE